MKTNSRDYQSVQNGNRPDSSYIRETIQRDKERKLPPRPLPPISKPLLQSEPESNNLPKINTSNEGILYPSVSQFQVVQYNCILIYINFMLYITFITRTKRKWGRN